MINQNKAPIYEALLEFKKNRIVPFDVPGHKRGKGNKELKHFLGEDCLSIDVNSMKCLDNLCHPVSCIKEAEELLAEAFNAHSAFFMVNGTTSAVQAMVLSTLKRNDKILLPRNVHRSVINSLVLCGAIPVYIDPGYNEKLKISLGMSVNDVKKAIEENKDAKAIFINNPTYYGICSNLKEITKIAHSYGLKVLVDEAHGTHFYFNDKLPMSAMEAKADMASVSMHKSGGSLTQSSILLCGENINANYVRNIINLTQTTSASYLLLSSLDLSRRNLALNGQEIFDKVIELCEYAREEINEIKDYYAFSKEIIDNDAVYDYDLTKLSINTTDTGLAGVEVYDLLRDEYDIQVEFGDLDNILAYVSIGDNNKNIERLIGALSVISKKYKKEINKDIQYKYIKPIVKKDPQTAFYTDSIAMPIKEAVNQIACEFVMCYPPGIPILAPGELITEEIIDYIYYCKDKGCSLLGTQDAEVNEIRVIKEV